MDDSSYIKPESITKYIGEINLPVSLEPNKCDKDVERYKITLEQTVAQMHPQIPPTALWLYNGSIRPSLIKATRYRPVQIRWVNKLPRKHLLAAYIDHSLDGAQKYITPDVRNAVHLHGGEQASDSDGGPLDWFTPGQYVDYYYPNEQQPTALFWHDHAVAITRLNVYAGLSGGVYIIKDKALEKNLRLPKGEYEVPLVISDKTYATDGSIIYPHHEPGVPFPDDQWASHFLGLMILVNNAVWPYMNVKRAKYRFRIVSGSDTRTYALKLYHADDLTKPGPPFVQIGTDGGYLPHPIVLEQDLLLMSGERADVIVDFSKYPTGTQFIMTSSANNPYPNGSPPNENNGRIMKFIVGDFPAECEKLTKIKVPENLFKRLSTCEVSTVRQLTLSVAGSPMMPSGLFLNNLMYSMPVTERPYIYTTEIWEIINLTAGAHPIHLHLIQFQLLNRQAYNVDAYKLALAAANPDTMPGHGIDHPVDVTPFLSGDPIVPTNQSSEYGWKDVIRANGNTITRIIVRFSPQDDNAQFPFDATVGSYTWHCHILSHEDNDMMRPYRLYNKY